MKPSLRRFSARLQWREVFGFALTLVGIVGLILYSLHIIG